MPLFIYVLCTCLYLGFMYVSINVDIMMLYISGRDQARKLKFSSDVHLPSINKMF